MDKSKIKKIAVFALILALIAISAIDIFTIHEDNTELCQWNQTLNACTDGRFLKTNYSNSNVIEIFLIAHNPSSTTMVLNLSINGTVVLEKHMRTNPANDAHLSISAMIPANTNYSVDASEVHHIEWREYQVTGSGLGSGLGQKGDKGDPGQNGTIGYNGTNGVNGTNGTSANMTEINNSLNLKLNKTRDTSGGLNMTGNLTLDSGYVTAGVDLNYSRVTKYNGTIRSFQYWKYGIEEWFLNNAAIDLGWISYTTPGAAPPYSSTSGFGINFYPPAKTNANLTRFVVYPTGFLLQVFNETAVTGNIFLNRTTGGITVSNLIGTGNRPVCASPNGDLILC